MYTDNIHRKWSLKFLSNYIIIQLLVVLIVIANWKKAKLCLELMEEIITLNLTQQFSKLLLKKKSNKLAKKF